MTMRPLLAAAALLFLASVSSDAQRRCVKGKPCGNSCIAQNRSCHIAPPERPATRTTPPTTKVPAKTSTDSSRARTLTGAAADTTQRAPVSTTTGQWVASRRGTTYYKESCSGARNLAVQNRIYFQSEADAIAAGYRRSRQSGC